ncbi:unnamed protein product [marine sediment metagenome]|uniref:Uncharacterized protein n=1 Tax=marine sediment metagenome TaxID=412755 RepID=X1N087_9ZZZZ
MKRDKQWIMTCVLTGARAYQLYCLNKKPELFELLSNLTSELDKDSVFYLVRRIEHIFEKGTKEASDDKRRV